MSLPLPPEVRISKHFSAESTTSTFDVIVLYVYNNLILLRYKPNIYTTQKGEPVGSPFCVAVADCGFYSPTTTLVAVTPVRVAGVTCGLAPPLTWFRTTVNVAVPTKLPSKLTRMNSPAAKPGCTLTMMT